MTYGKKYPAEVKFLVDLWEVLAELNQGLGRSGEQRPCTGEGKTLSRGFPCGVVSPLGATCQVVSWWSPLCRAAQHQEPFWNGCSGWRSSPQNSLLLSMVWKQRGILMP